MEKKQLSPHVFYTEPDRKRDRPVLGYIRGERCAVMVDAGNSARHLAEFRAAFAGEPEPEVAIITHWHWDHTFGMHAAECEMVASEATGKELRRMAAWRWDEASMRQRVISGEEILFADEHIRAEYDRPEEIRVVEATRYIRENLRIDCGGVVCDCLLLPSAHCEGSIVVHLPGEGILFLGDIYNDDFYRDHYRDLQKTRALREALEALAFEVAVPGHGDPLSKEALLAFLGRF